MMKCLRPQRLMLILAAFLALSVPGFATGAEPGRVAGAVRASAAAAAPQKQADTAAALQAWLMRMHEGHSRRAYVGTFVVSSGVDLSSARIWHVCEGQDQVERVESLTGTPRSVFRHNDQVLTLWPEAGLARSEKRESLGLFPDRLRLADGSLAEHYSLQASGQVDRVAGLGAEMVQLQPRDAWRFGYRIWVAQHSGLVVKLQTLDNAGQVLEQSAFSELQLDPPIRAEHLLRMMSRTKGYRVERLQPVKTALEAEGWGLGQAVPGFKELSCHKRIARTAASSPALHCVFSDGLASVSLFLAPLAARTEAHDTFMAMGATHSLRTQVHQHSATLMGEVPPATLKRFAAALERRKTNP